MSPAAVRFALIPACLLCTCMLSSRSRAAFEVYAAGPRSSSLGNAVVAAPPDGWAAFTNPAGVGFCRFPSIGVFHSPGLFGLVELRLSGCGLSLPVAGFGLALSATWFGWDAYKETSIRIAVAEEAVSGIGLGLRCRIDRLAIRGYGSCTEVTLDLGLRVECSRTLAIGGILTNVGASELQSTGESLPQELSGGIWYAPIPELHIVFEAGKELLSAPEIRCGVEADILEQLTLRAGIVDTPSIVSGGCAIRLGEITADYAFTYHWVLGATHEMGITISLP
jgi:hypothetical protein